MKLKIVILLVIVMATGCLTEEAYEPIIETYNPAEEIYESFVNASNSIMNTKLEAIIEKDIDKYMSTITNRDIYYRNEQGRWFTEMTKEGMNDISFEVVSAELKDENTSVVVIRQKHSYNIDLNITYPLLFKYEDKKWMDCGYDFEVINTPRHTLKYMPGETRALVFKDIIDHVYENLEDIFEERPDENFEIKLFHDREMLRQRTVPSIAWRLTGWGEPNESLKLYTGFPNLEGYYITLQHELVHHITMKICKNNLSAWLLEGVAMNYGNAYFEPSLSSTLSSLKREDIAMTIEELEATDLYNVTNPEEIRDWYNTSYMYVYYIIETYGHDGFMELFYDAGERPFNDSVMNQDFKAQNKVSTEEVLLKVLNRSKEELSEDYLNWLETASYFDQ